MRIHNARIATIAQGDPHMSVLKWFGRIAALGISAAALAACSAGGAPVSAMPSGATDATKIAASAQTTAATAHRLLRLMMPPRVALGWVAPQHSKSWFAKSRAGASATYFLSDYYNGNVTMFDVKSKAVTGVITNGLNY